MIARFLCCLIIAALVVGGFVLVGWVIVSVLEHHLRFVIGFSVCALAAVCYVELGPESLEQH